MKLSEHKIAALVLIFKLILRNLFPKRINHSGINNQSRGFRLGTSYLTKFFGPLMYWR